MKRNISRWALTLALAFTATNAFAQDEEGEPAETEEAADAEGEAAPVEEEEATAGATTDAEAEADAAVTTDDIDDSKFFIGLRLGYGIPLGTLGTYGGELGGEVKLSDAVSGQIPIWIDLAYRVTPNLLLGVYGAYGFALLAGDVCDEADECSGSDIRFGIQGQYHLSPGESVNPWFGLGAGYEILNTHVKDDDQVADGTFKGFEFLNLHAGADFKLSDTVGLGPFVSFSLGQYSSYGFGDESEDMDETAMHQWLTIGARGAFSL